ncbi:2-phospho-L-lactate guanylyltransferase [Murinocardiopsis flavida]|uniref:Phosphoenolpyruvate guanylyltransferase n=1 Tax=Murinocardiopsis flavida TaxID=645275 RepID=A0A2P8DEG8_9ACTN|nr:2-phospho-L-lactate guanylyltransferase [Murinocardiopsis flavida]PSK95589.1 2-phospho-L-lactate guanylyltransferase [Murinocardiopsis flavida]
MKQSSQARRVSSWVVVVPVKRLGAAKSRLAAYTGPHRGDLALAVALDTVSAVLRTPGVRSVVVVTADPVAAAALRGAGALIVGDEPGTGLNPALRHGALAAAELYPAAGRAALSADLPALRPAELDRALTAAGRHPNAFLADAPGVGTTLYTAAPGAAFTPAFEGASRRRHSDGGAVELRIAGVDSVRRDVDTPGDLLDASALGVGARTADVLSALGECGGCGHDAARVPLG